MSDVELLVRSLPGTHFQENNHSWVTVREDVLVQVIEKIIEGKYDIFKPL